MKDLICIELFEKKKEGSRQKKMNDKRESFNDDVFEKEFRETENKTKK